MTKMQVGCGAEGDLWGKKQAPGREVGYRVGGELWEAGCRAGCGASYGMGYRELQGALRGEL